MAVPASPGVAHGRNGDAGSCAVSVLAISATDTDPAAAASACRGHWQNWGSGELRTGTRKNKEDKCDYADCRPDMCAKYAKQSTLQCALNYGNLYPDLQKAFCSGAKCTNDNQAELLLNHWKQHGAGEGRDGMEYCLQQVKPSVTPGNWMVRHTHTRMYKIAIQLSHHAR